MRILQVMAGGKFGGAETAFVDMCIAMHEAGEDIEVVTRANAGRVPRLEAAGIRVHTLPFGGKLDIYTPWRMRRIIKNFKPDIVQSWMSRGAWHCPRWQDSMGAPRYLNVARLGGYYKLKYFKNIDYFTTITPDIKRYLVENGIAPENVRHINNFAETEDAPTPVRRADYGVPEDATLLISLGRLHTSKAFDTLIRAVAQTEGVYAWIAGEGPDRAGLEALIAELGMERRVHLLGWRDDRAALLQAADICVFPSRYEPFGTVFVQAWAQKTPLVTTKSDGPRQFVHDGEDGLVVPIDDIGALTAAIERVAEDKALAARLVRAGYQRYQNEFTKQSSLAGYLGYYREIRAREGLS